MGTSVAPTAARRAPLRPFEQGTRRRVQQVGQYSWTPGTPVPTITLPQVGYLSGIYVKIEGTITQTAAGATLSPFGYGSLINRARVSANLGSASIVDLSGPSLDLIQRWHAPSVGSLRNTYGNAIAANPVSYGVRIPINANNRTLLKLGLINLQAEQVRVTLDLIPAQLAAFITAGGGTLTPNLTVYVSVEYWDVPRPGVYEQPAPTIARLLEDTIPIANTGDQIYVIPRLGTLAQMTEYFLFNGALANLQAPTPQISAMRLRANKTDYFLQYDARTKEMEEQLFYNTAGGSFMAPGCYTWDFFHSGQQTRNYGDRDLINTEAITTLESIATVDPSVAIAGTCQRTVVRRVFQALV